MRLSKMKQHLETMNAIQFKLPNGSFVPSHFHITEVGQLDKRFMDCGGFVRYQRSVTFQLWETDDLDHRLTPQKVNDIIALSERVLGLEDGDIEVEYQSDTIGKYGLEFDGVDFLLTARKTTCLASDNCGVPMAKQNIQLSELRSEIQACCTPGSGCC